MANQPISSQYNNPIVVTALLSDVDTAGGLVSLINGAGVDLVVLSAVLNVGTASTGACTVSIGYTATSGTTLSSTLISGQTVASTGTFQSAVANAVRWVNGKWITASTASGASAGLVGTLYLTCIPVPAGG